ncbi:MAG: hypothetical protein PHH84_04305 [Oscillospiraceae bacterium]|nr:hypothetical protein [Oscillospiraceae bacterium]MDD4414883.1 hypothetical protein [Oscillospiraceae bacterium]
MKPFNIQSIISGILSFLMMICITLLVISISLQLTIFDINYISDKMDNDYYDSVIDSLTTTLKDDISPPSGMPEEVFDDLFNRYIIMEDTQASINAILTGIDYSYDSTRVHDILLNRFTKYANEKNVKISDTNFDTLIDYCLVVYERHISLPFMKSFSSVRRLFDNTFTYLLLAVSTALILLIIFLFAIHRFKHRAIRYCIYSLFASALLVIPFPIFLLIQGAYRKISLSPVHVKELFVSLIQTSLVWLLISGLLIAALGFALIPLVKRLRKNALKAK